MTIDVTQVTNLIVEKHLERLGEEVDLVFLFGSRERGTAHPNSDMDLCYTPVHESTWTHCTITIQNILFDLFPQRWSQLEHKADFNEPGVSLLLDARIVHHRNKEALARFQQLQDRVRELMQPPARPYMVKKAQSIFQQTGYPFLQLQLATRQNDLLSAKSHAKQIVSAITHSLMVLNQACIDTRRPSQVLALPQLPQDCETLLDQIYGASDANKLATACEQLLQHTRALLLAEQHLLPEPNKTYAEAFQSLYPELKDMVQHILRGCEAEDPYMTTDAVLMLQEEVALPLAQLLTGITCTELHTPADYWHHLSDLGFPDLLPALIARDYTTLAKQALAFDRRLRALLVDQAVPLNDFDSIRELSTHLNTYVSA